LRSPFSIGRRAIRSTQNSVSATRRQTISRPSEGRTSKPVADLLQVIRARLLRTPIRRHVVENDGAGRTRFPADDLAEREPA
jgi:hypothetical protein